jgi:DNA-binding LytR/AlgR family response regulator
MYKKILVIDDEPERAHRLGNIFDLRIAHGYEQVKFWLRNPVWRPDIIFLDNDMPLASGTSIAKEFALDMIGTKIVIWSMNGPASKEIEGILASPDHKVDGFNMDISIIPFGSYSAEEWQTFLRKDCWKYNS